MSQLLDRYLDRVFLSAKKAGPEKDRLREELHGRLSRDIADREAAGQPREEAILASLQESGDPQTLGYSLRTGFAWIDVRTKGTARGVIAIGPRAVGIVAFGGIAIGIVALGGVSIGLLSMGGLALGLLVWGGLGLGGLAYAGLAVGVVAFGGVAVGAVANGGTAYGLWVARAHEAHSHFTAENVPAWIRALDPLLAIPNFLTRHMFPIMTVFDLLIVTLILIQLKEARRSGKTKNWMLES